MSCISRASRWYQENGLYIPAIEHALAGDAAEQAALLLEQAIEVDFHQWAGGYDSYAG